MAEIPLTVVTADGTSEVAAAVDGERILLEPAALAEATGWELKPEGLCRGELCVPVRPTDGVAVDGRVDLGAMAAVMRRPLAVELDGVAVAVLGEAAADRAAAMASAVAPPFDLETVDGGRVTLDQFAGRKRLLHAWASW